MEKLLIDIIDNFAKEEVVFTNEQQFQFALALALKKYKGVNVDLEVLSIDTEWDEIENNIRNKRIALNKEYTDLIVEQNGIFYAIELKMKTANRVHVYKTSRGKFITMKQGAENENTYRFFEDVSRLENINKRKFGRKLKIAKSFAILLTNSAIYRNNDRSNNNIWRNYAINENRIVEGTLFFGNDLSYHTTRRKNYKAIELISQYGPFKWRKYELLDNGEPYRYTSKSPEFHYLIVTINSY